MILLVLCTALQQKICPCSFSNWAPEKKKESRETNAVKSTYIPCVFHTFSWSPFPERPFLASWPAFHFKHGQPQHIRHHPSSFLHPSRHLGFVFKLWSVLLGSSSLRPGFLFYLLFSPVLFHFKNFIPSSQIPLIVVVLPFARNVVRSSARRSVQQLLYIVFSY